MKKLINNKVDKAMISSLKKVEFDGNIYVVKTKADAERAVDYLLSQPILGFDTETRPAFEKGKNRTLSCCRTPLGRQVGNEGGTGVE